MAFDAFLQIEGIQGESSDDKHKDWIEVLSYNHGLSQPSAGSRSTGGAASAERCNHSDFSIVKALDKSSPKIALFCCNGKHITSVKLELCRATDPKTTYMEYKLSDCIISSYRPGGSGQGGEALPLEEVSFNYGKIEWKYIQTDPKSGSPKGNVEANWDLTKNTGA